MAGCFIPGSQRTRRPLCPCGGRNAIRVVVEYVAQGRTDYAGGRFCYHSDALIDIEIPAGATPVQAMLYDLHEPDEIIRITFSRMEPDPDGNLPGQAEQGAYLA